MLEAQFPSVQHLPRKSFGLLFAVDLVAENWMAKMLKVHPHLMCPAAVQPAFDQTHLIRRTQNAIFCLRCAAASGCSRHSLSIYRMTSNFLFNSSRALPQLSRNEREINLLYRARSELPRQSTVRHVGFCDDQTTARFFVQPMNDSRSFFAADSGQLRKVMQQRIDQCVLTLTGARMND